MKAPAADVHKIRLEVVFGNRERGWNGKVIEMSLPKLSIFIPSPRMDSSRWKNKSKISSTGYFGYFQIGEENLPGFWAVLPSFVCILWINFVYLLILFLNEKARISGKNGLDIFGINFVDYVLLGGAGERLSSVVKLCEAFGFFSDWSVLRNCDRIFFFPFILFHLTII